MEKTIKYLENGEYHYATVRSVGDLAQLKTNSKETLVEAINELWNGGGNADLSKAPKPEGYDQLVQDVADAVKNQQEISQQWIEWQNEEAQLTEERKQAYLQAMKEMQEAIDKAKADAAALDDKTTKLDEQITKTFSDLDTSIQNMHEQLQKEADRMDQELIDTKSDLTKVRTDLQNAQLDNGRIHDELTNINGKFEHKVWQTDLDPLKEQIDRAETSVQQTKDELLGKASRQDLDTVTNTVSKLDTQLKETAKGVEISVKKDELGGEIAEALTNKTNILLGTRRFTTNNWQQREHVEMCSDPWKGFLVAKQNSPIEGIQQAYEAKAGTTYTFSLFAKMDTLDDSNKPQIILAKNNLDTSLDTKIDVWRKEIEDITSDFKRYDLTFTPSEDCTIYPHVISNSNNPIFVCGYQLEIGKTSTPWEPNQEDVGDYVEKSEAQFNVYNDKIQALTEKQRQQGDTQEKLRTEVTQTAEGTRQVSENLKKTNDDITKLRGEFEVKADHMKSEYETYTNKAVGQISDSTLNLIRNSSFQNKDEDFAQWQNVSAKVNVRQDENGLRWVELTQSGMTTDNPQGLTSNYFNIKQGKVTIAVDIKSGDKATLDNESVLFLELYNEAKKRVDFRFVTLSELGLGISLLGDHKVHRGLYRLGIDRNDAKYMTVKAHLMRNGDLWFTNFSARLSSIDDGAYEPNPDDLNQQILKQNTKIEQNSKEVAIKANSVDVTRDIKSAVDGVNVGAVNLVTGTNKPFTMGYGIPNTTWNDNAACVSLPVKVINSEILPQETEFYYMLVGGKTYTQAIWVDTDAKLLDPAKLQLTWFTSEAGHNYQAAKLIRLGENSYKVISTFTCPQKYNSPTRLFDLYNLDKTFDIKATGSYLKFRHPMLTEGNKSTDWSPAVNDTSLEIKSAKNAAIEIASDRINLSVNKISTTFNDKLDQRINESSRAQQEFTENGIEQTVEKITSVKNDVNNLWDEVKVTNTQLTSSIKNLGDRITTEVNGLTVREDSISKDIKELNSKWNVAQSEISGKVSETEVNSLLDKKNYATKSWAQSSLVMKKDAVTIESVRSSIRDYTQTKNLQNVNIDDLKTEGHYFVKDLIGNPLPGWVYVDVVGSVRDRIRQDVYLDTDGRHVSRKWVANTWTPWQEEVTVDNLISKINVSPEKITIASNKILIDGDTDIHGNLRVDDVKLIGRRGYVDMSGDKGIELGGVSGSKLRLEDNRISLGYDDKFSINLMPAGMNFIKFSEHNKVNRLAGSVVLTEHDNNINLALVYNPRQDYYNQFSNGIAPSMSLGYYKLDTSVDPMYGGMVVDQMLLFAKDTVLDDADGKVYKKGIHFQDPVYAKSNVYINNNASIDVSNASYIIFNGEKLRIGYVGNNVLSLYKVKPDGSVASGIGFTDHGTMIYGGIVQ